jgi:prevent-host-death family protein
MRWEMDDAAERFEELLRRATEQGPQVVSRGGEDLVVVLAADEYRRTQHEPREPPPA